MSLNAKFAGTMLAAWVAVSPAFGCGPHFPNTFLTGDEAALDAPAAEFCGEIERMKLTPPIHRRVTSDKGFASEAADADLADLQIALEKAGVKPAARQTILNTHCAERQKLRALADYTEQLRESERPQYRILPPTKPAPAPTSRIVVTTGLPGEFADYFRGAIAWHTGDEIAAIASWRALLERPAGERHFRSVWAAFMLGKAHLKREPQKAVEWFQQTRLLARQGFADSIGLAASSLGWEAKVYFKQKHWVPAIELYLDQAATGDESAFVSLRWLAAVAFKQDAKSLAPLAAHTKARRVMTAYLLAVREKWWNPEGLEPRDEAGDPSAKWLAAAESAGVRDVESAEQLALAAYRAGQMETAQRWIQRAAVTPITQWLQAKLLLRGGNVDAAAALMEKIAKHFPVQPPTTNTVAALSLADNLYVLSEVGDVSTPRQVLGELGALRLARREYVLALDALLRSSFWMDAAYVAERVLSADELKAYVDRHWPAWPRVPAKAADATDYVPMRGGADTMSPDQQNESIRWLLARRLARQHRFSEARPYYPAMLQPRLDELARSFATGNAAALTAQQRAAALWTAACLTRTNGMELIGTEAQPDWAMHEGNFEDGPTVAGRASLRGGLAPSADEIRRSQRKEASPETRFHYRYVAASLAMKAAALMPDNSDETANVLCTAGDWLKNRDPKAATVFYRALVRRCPKTALGAEADRQRWFPLRDAAGRPLPKPKRD
ncbi:MAG: hypothetical protein NT105_07855 [Verrucomicrobia bacterium]|nr:hypothetical protein [Verrucomicrobiota bacterium]